jgi:hypothetical protein
VADSLYEINSNNLLDGPKSSLSAPAENSKIFYYKSNEEASCKITAGNSNGAVELKPVVIDYQLAQNLDFSSCNGVVDFNKGCVLFNQRIQDGASLKKLNFDADIANFSSLVTDSEKDSNIILKVTPDRVCDKWLAPRSYIKDEKDNNVIFDIGLCDALDENNNCSSFISSLKINQTVNDLGADRISNLSGYAKVGINGGSLGGDYYPFGAMEQKGEITNVANGGFEYYGSNGYPIGWNWSGQAAANKSWDNNIFSVINNPISAQVEGIGNAREGQTFLKVGSSYDATSEDVDVIPGIEYIITAYVNTKNLKTGAATIDVLSENGINLLRIAQDLGSDWIFKVGRFTASGSRIKVRLGSVSAATSAEGNFYFDDIKIRPALKSKDNWHTTQSCRLYPKTDSTSCDYYEDSGDRQKGWYGYCLEYDRAPGDPNSCILWYPIDKVKGDGVEEGAGYLGKMPVYYCLESAVKCGGANGYTPEIYCTKLVKTVNEVGQNKYWSSRVYQGSNYVIPGAAANSGKYIYWGASNGGREDIVLSYGADSTPFGAMMPPDPVNNPYEWDGIVNTATDTNVQPILVKKTGARAGVPYYGESIKCTRSDFGGNTYANCGNVYTENLGVWDDCRLGSWSDDCSNLPGSYSKDANYNWTASHSDCCGDGGTLLTVRNSCYNEGKVNMASGASEAKKWVKNIFAQSYGVWEWGLDGMCQSNINAKCRVGMDQDPCGGNSCEANGRHVCSYKASNAGSACSAVAGPSCNCQAVTGSITCSCDASRTPGQECYGETGCDSYQNESDCNANPHTANYGYRCGGVLSGAQCCYGSSLTSSDCVPQGSCANDNNVNCDLNNTTQCGADGPCVSDPDKQQRYAKVIGEDWGPPQQVCLNQSGSVMSVRSDNISDYLNTEKDYCAIPTYISNIKVNGLSGNIDLAKNGFINLTFNSLADSQQLPLVMYAVDWGDDEKTTVTGVEMRDRPDPAPGDSDNNGNPHSLYHLYSYWDLKAKANSGITSIDCSTAGECKVRPKIQIKDNWGWCSGGTGINDCGHWQPFGASVVVKEK